MSAERIAKIVSEGLGGAQAEVVRVTGSERLSRCFRFEIDLEVGDDHALDLDAMLAHPAALAFLDVDEEVRVVYGAVNDVQDVLDERSARLLYRVTLVPRVEALGLNQLIEVFVEQSVPDIIRGRLLAAGLKEGEDFELRLQATYAPREFVVQYRESDLTFVTRLAEHHGITFWFEHGDGRDVIVFADEEVGTDRGRSLPFAPDGRGRAVRALRARRRRVAAAVMVNDYDYMHPQLDLSAQATVAPDGHGTVYDFGDNFATEAEAKRIAQVRAEALATERETYVLTSDDAGLYAGCRFDVVGHRAGDLELLAVEVEHVGEHGSFDEDGTREPRFRNLVKAIPVSVPFRPQRTTPRPRVHGMHSGIIDADEKSEYAAVDEHGRYKVKLFMDVSDAAGDRASLPIRMAQPHTGAGYGMHFPLRPGAEVLVAFLDGDPDRPVISASVPNALTPSVVATDNKVKNVIRTGGGNEIDFDDTTDGQRIKLSTPNRGTVFQIGSPNAAESGAILSTDGVFSTIAMTGSVTGTNVASMIGGVKSALFGDIIQWAGVFPWDRILGVLKAVAGGVSEVNAINEMVNHTARLVADQLTEVTARLAEEIVALEASTALVSATAATVLQAKQDKDDNPDDEKAQEKYDQAVVYHAQAQIALEQANDAVQRLQEIEQMLTDSMVTANTLPSRLANDGVQGATKLVSVVASILTIVWEMLLKSKIRTEQTAASTELKTFNSTLTLSPIKTRMPKKKLQDVGKGIANFAKSPELEDVMMLFGLRGDDTLHILNSDESAILRGGKLCFVESPETVVHGKKYAVLSSSTKTCVAGKMTEVTAETVLNMKAATIQGEALQGPIALKVGSSTLEMTTDGITLKVGTSEVSMTADAITIKTPTNTVEVNAEEIGLTSTVGSATISADGVELSAQSPAITVGVDEISLENGSGSVAIGVAETTVDGSTAGIC